MLDRPAESNLLQSVFEFDFTEVELLKHLDLNDAIHLSQTCKAMQHSVAHYQIQKTISYYNHLQPSELSAWIVEHPLQTLAVGVGGAITMVFGMQVPMYAAVGGALGVVGGGAISYASGASLYATVAGISGAIQGYFNGTGVVNNAIQSASDALHYGHIAAFIGAPVGGVIGVGMGVVYASGLPVGIGILSGAMAAGVSLFKHVSKVEDNQKELHYARLAYSS